jgi:hypothetical protein
MPLLFTNITEQRAAEEQLPAARFGLSSGAPKMFTRQKRTVPDQRRRAERRL